MSSRALRRAQKELEAKELEEKKQSQQDEADDESEEEVVLKAPSKPSLFALLGDGGDDDDDEEEEAEVVGEAGVSNTNPSIVKSENEVPLAAKSSKSKKKKKKSKGKGKATKDDLASKSANAMSGLDEIDQALQALNLTAGNRSGTDTDHESGPSEELKQLFAALAVDTQHLHAANEMKKLFGRAALRDTDDEAQPRQRGHGQQGGIAAAAAGRNTPGSRNLAAIGLRRNIFIQGKEEWPRATSGGLGMEVVEKRPDGTVEYRFVHNGMYQEVQHKFQTSVASMDPDQMIQLLHYNPYHISTLLQVSEISTQRRDNATASDLLERALFTFGRSVHSTFSANLTAGKARLDFRRPENREFWLAVWRYIATLGVRATWRTALEWGKLLVAMSPEKDPYCIRLLIDQLALRGRDPQALVDIVEADYLEREWKVPPNLAFSIALAYDRLKQPQKARTALRNGVKEYPWLAARLCKELDISPIPKPVWGKEPNGDHQELLCELYVPKTKDLWNTTEGTSLLVEICYSFEEDLGAGEAPYWLAEIPELDIARHVVLSDDRSLLSLLDNRVKSKYTSVSDPLPPDDNLPSYQPSSAARPRPDTSEAVLAHLRAQLNETMAYYYRIDLERLVREGLSHENLAAALDRAGSNFQEFRRISERMQEVRMRLQEAGEEVVYVGGAEQPGNATASDTDD